MEALEAAKRALEREVEVLRAEIHGDGEGESRAVLLDAKKRLEKENKRLLQKLEEEAAARTAVELAAHQGQSELTFVKGVLQEDVHGKVDKLEQERRRLLATVAEQAEQLRVKDREIELLQKTKSVLAEERDRLQVQLDDEAADKAEEANGRRKSVSQVKELKMRLEVEQNKMGELTQQVITWRSKAQATQTELAAFLLAKDKAVRQESQAQASLKETQVQLKDAQDARRKAEEAAMTSAAQLDDLKERLDEDAEEFANLSRQKRQLELDLAEAKNVTTREIQVREKALAELRERSMKDVHQLTVEVESGRATIASLRTQLKEAQTRCDGLAQQLEEESRGKQSAQREAERQAARAADQQRASNEAFQQASQLREEIAQLSEQLARAKASVADVDLVDALEKAKAQLDKKLQDAMLENDRLLRDNAALAKKAALATQELQENTELLEEEALATSRAEEKLRKLEFQLAEVNALRKRDAEAREALEKSNADLAKQVRDLGNQVLLIESTISLEGPRTRRQYDEQLVQLQAQFDSADQKLSETEKALRRANKANTETALRLTEAEKSRMQYEDLVAKLEAETRKLQTQVDDLENAATDRAIALKRSQREAEEALDRAHKAEREMSRYKSKLARVQLEA